MITKATDPIGWAFLMEELEDAHEHLGNLIDEMNHGSDYGEGNLRVDLGHVYAHLNRAWARRNATQDLTEIEWNQASGYPNDLHPI